MIGTVLRQIRIEHQLTQEELARRADMPQQNISRLEMRDGDGLSTKTLGKLARGYGMDPVALYVLIEHKKRTQTKAA